MMAAHTRARFAASRSAIPLQSSHFESFCARRIEKKLMWNVAPLIPCIIVNAVGFFLFFFFFFFGRHWCGSDILVEISCPLPCALPSSSSYHAAAVSFKVDSLRKPRATCPCLGGVSRFVSNCNIECVELAAWTLSDRWSATIKWDHFPITQLRVFATACLRAGTLPAFCFRAAADSFDRFVGSIASVFRRSI